MRKYKGYEFREAVTAFAHKAAKALDTGLTVVTWDSEATTASINQNALMRLPDVRDDAVLTQVQLMKYTGYILHELMHSKYTAFGDWDGIKERASSRGLDGNYVFKMWNAIEDAWIENRAIRENVVGNVEGAMTAMADHVMQRAFDVNSRTGITRWGIDWTDPAQYPFVFAFALRKHGTVRPRIARGLQPIIDGAAQRLEQTTDTRGNVETAIWVVEQLAQLNQDQQDQPDQPRDDGQPQDGGQPGDQPDDGDQPGGDGQPENGSENDENGAGDANGDEVGDAQAPTPGDGENGLNPELSMDGVLERDAYGNGWSFSESDILEEGQPNDCLSARQIRTINHAANAGLRHEVRRLFENTATDGWSTKRKTGAINVSALPNIATGSDRLFKRRYEADGIDSAVMILVDCSGSMSDFVDGRRLIDIAADTAYTVGEALHRAGVRVGAAAFDGDLTPLARIGVRPSKLRDLMGRITPNGGTCDLQALRWAHSTLAKCREQRKVVIVMTDGEGAPPSYITKQVRIGQALGVDTIAIGIQHNVKHYINAVTVNDVSELGSTTMKQLKLAA